MITKEQKQYLAAGGVVLLVIIVVVALQMGKTDTGLSPEDGSQATPNQATSTPTSTPEASDAQKPAAPKAPAKALTYEEALKLYEGRRIFFNPNCSMSPSQVTFKNGTSVMFDNRGTQAITIRLGESPFTIKALDYMLIRVTSKTLPNTISVDCGASYNVGSILLQQ